jgi:hypothetical protein
MSAPEHEAVMAFSAPRWSLSLVFNATGTRNEVDAEIIALGCVVVINSRVKSRRPSRVTSYGGWPLRNWISSSSCLGYTHYCFEVFAQLDTFISVSIYTPEDSRGT